MASTQHPRKADPELLLERERELAAMERAVTGARRGEGMLVVVEGPAGIGKTALLEATRGLVEPGESLVLEARGAELERDHPYGVVRQLYLPALRRLPADQLTELFTGVAELAAPLVAPPGATAPRAAAKPSQDISFAVLHGLYWLTADLAARQPLLIIVDDAHWADSPSLRFVLHLARRLEGLPVLLVVSLRSGQPVTDEALLDRIISEPGLEALRPGPLSERAVARLLRDMLGTQPEDPFAKACRDATRGTPFLVRELGRALAVDQVPPTGESANRVEEFGPETVAHATLLRLSSLTPGAAALARAVAILGPQAELQHCARLGDLDEEQALQSLDALVDAQVLSRERPLRFIHPLIRAAIYESLPPHARSSLHARAAEFVAAEGATPDAVAGHLLKTEPAGRAEVVHQLHDAAAHAVERGAPESAVTYLRRALDEGALPKLRAQLLRELGRAEALLRQPSAIEHLQEAQRLTEDPVQRAQIKAELAEILVFAGQWQASIELVESALADAGERDPALLLRLQTFWAAHASFDPRRVEQYDRRLPQLRAAAEGGGADGRALSLLLGSVAALRGEGLDTVLPLLERGLDDGRFLADEGSESWALPQALGAWMVFDELDRAAALADEMIDDARARGSVLGLVAGLAHRAWISTRRGELRVAEADARPALELALEHGLVFALPLTLSYVLDALVERPELADIAATVDRLKLEPALFSAAVGCFLLEVRGRLRLLAGEVPGGLDDLRGCLRTAESVKGRYLWTNVPPAHALALATDDPDEARDLSRTLLDDARRLGRSRLIGIALRTEGLLVGGNEGLAKLHEAAEVLRDSPARLEEARTLLELGAALRRSNEPATARDPLRAGLDRAEQCGATRLAERARAELAATGARPRRARITGRDALTPGEERIARMAADGMTNREIAQTLFVTAKTVENQLGRAYRKLGIRSRRELASQLDGKT